MSSDDAVEWFGFADAHGVYTEGRMKVGAWDVTMVWSFGSSPTAGPDEVTIKSSVHTPEAAKELSKGITSGVLRRVEHAVTRVVLDAKRIATAENDENDSLVAVEEIYESLEGITPKQDPGYHDRLLEIYDILDFRGQRNIVKSMSDRLGFSAPTMRKKLERARQHKQAIAAAEAAQQENNNE